MLHGITSQSYRHVYTNITMIMYCVLCACLQGEVAFDGTGDRNSVLRFFQYRRKLHEYCASVNQSVATVHVHTTKDSLAIGQVTKCS